MSRFESLGRVACLVVVLIAGACGRTVDPERLSVVLVTLDTSRADRFGAYGGTSVPTPNFDRIAEEGVVFLDATSQVPLTLPAHASILTGRYPASHGVRHNGIYRLPDSAETLTERLADRGFVTAGFVAAYVLNRGFGVEQGFETFDDVPVNRFEGGRDQLFEAERTADEVNSRVFAWLDERSDETGRMFLWVHYYDPHDPYDPPETEGRTLHGEGYDREISYLDHAFGELIDRLSADGWLDRSLLVVVGDHGESLNEHGERTHGLFVYESALRVPMFMRAPGLLPAGARIDGPVELVDIAPTVMELLGHDPLERAQGGSLRGRIDGSEDGTLELAYAESLMPRLEFGWSELRAVRDGRFKFIEAPTPELYDLRDDPGEQSNLAPNDPERVAELAGLLGRWRASTEGDGSIEEEATRELSAEEMARLQSLGYMQAGLADAPSSEQRPDPKDRIGELRQLDAARDALAEGRPEAALDGVAGLLADNAFNHNARSTRISALIELGRFREAEEEARAGLSLATSGPHASPSVAQKNRGLLAASLQLQGRLSEAEGVYREMLASDPTDDNAAVDLARMWIEAGRPTEALDLLAPVLERSPRNGMALCARFLAEFALGHEPAYSASARRIADARAGDAETLIRVGDLLVRQGDHARAAAAYEVAQEQIDLDPTLLGRLGTARMRSGNLQGAADVFEAIAAMRPNDPRGPFFLGTIELQRGDEAAARRHFEAALRRDPRFTAGLVRLGEFLRDRGRIDEARSALEEAIERNPSDSRAHSVLESIDR